MVKVFIIFFIGGETVETTKFYRANWTDFAISEFIRKDALAMGADGYEIKVER